MALSGAQRCHRLPGDAGIGPPAACDERWGCRVPPGRETQTQSSQGTGLRACVT